MQKSGVPVTNRTAETKPLAHLHLNVRTINVLQKAGITTVGELVGRFSRGVVSFPGAGELTLREIEDTLNALEGATDSRGTVDWTSYARARGFMVLPAISRSSWSARQFLDQLPDTVKMVVRLQYRVVRGAEIGTSISSGG